MNKNEQKENTAEEGDSGASFTRIIVGAVLAAVLLLAVKFFPGISETINRLLQ